MLQREESCSSTRQLRQEVDWQKWIVKKILGPDMLVLFSFNNSTTFSIIIIDLYPWLYMIQPLKKFVKNDVLESTLKHYFFLSKNCIFLVEK